MRLTNALMFLESIGIAFDAGLIMIQNLVGSLNCHRTILGAILSQTTPVEAQLAQLEKEVYTLANETEFNLKS
jgi:hypothetical protein